MEGKGVVMKLLGWEGGVLILEAFSMCWRI